jgi:hypothetical protein
MRNHSIERSFRGLSKKARIEPFVIFCLHQRPELADRNPEFTNSQLTATLGRMWRTMPSEDKQEYYELALSVVRSHSPLRPRARKRSALPKAHDAPASESISFTDSPHLWVVSRGSSGACAAAASQHLVEAATLWTCS